MGVSGSGKSTIGALLAARLGWKFFDADEYHPPANVEKMKAGIPLDDDDRTPWLSRLNNILRNERHAVLACSALKEAYRERLTDGIPESRIVFLKGEKRLIQVRLAARQHKYMPASLLDSQFAALEPPADAIAVDIAQDPMACVEVIAERLG
jgi:gluconokinase